MAKKKAESVMACRTLALNGRDVFLREGAGKAADPDYPLIVAIHGGGYSSEYFDLDEFSMVRRAEALGFPIMALDRPGYGNTPNLEPDELSHEGNAKAIEGIIGDYWRSLAQPPRGVVLVGHSIGGAIAATIAARRPSWPLLGIAISGVGFHHAEDNSADLSSMSGSSYIDLPPAYKDSKMFGPTGTFHPGVPGRLRQADASAPAQDIVDIVMTWPRVGGTILSGVSVPVHYRQAEFDGLWKVDADEIDRVAEACSSAPWVDAGIFGQTGHCIDFHRVGAAFQLEQLAFAVKCAVYADLG